MKWLCELCWRGQKAFSVRRVKRIEKWIIGKDSAYSIDIPLWAEMRALQALLKRAETKLCEEDMYGLQNGDPRKSSPLFCLLLWALYFLSLLEPLRNSRWVMEEPWATQKSIPLHGIFWVNSSSWYCFWHFLHFWISVILESLHFEEFWMENCVYERVDLVQVSIPQQSILFCLCIGKGEWVDFDFDQIYICLILTLLLVTVFILRLQLIMFWGTVYMSFAIISLEDRA